MNHILQQCQDLVVDSNTGIPLPFQNVGIATDIRLAQIDGSAWAHKDHTIVQIPEIPRWLWGHRLIYPAPPADGDFERWDRDFSQAFPEHPEPKQRSFSWDGTHGESGVDQPFLDAGYRSMDLVLMTGHSFTRPAQANQSMVVRPLTREADWASMIDCAYDAKVERRDDPAYRDDMKRMFTRYRRITQDSRSLWFGAFDGERLAGTLGIFGWGTLGRYQGVVVREEYRRQGVGRQLVYESAHQAQEVLGIRDFIIGSIKDSSPQRLYEEVGFQSFQRERALVRQGNHQEEKNA